MKEIMDSLVTLSITILDSNVWGNATVDDLQQDAKKALDVLIHQPEVDANPYNMTYVEHAQNFWKWLLPIPADQSPMEDPTGEKCTNGQANSNSSVFYLAHNSGGRSERTCEVPAGKGLLIPVMEVEWELSISNS